MGPIVLDPCVACGASTVDDVDSHVDRPRGLWVGDLDDHATACSRSSHSTLVMRCRAVSSITTESWRSRNRTGAHNSPGRGGTHSVTAMS